VALNTIKQTNKQTEHICGHKVLVM